jgi:hypothetical protein
MLDVPDATWLIHVRDRDGRRIYLTAERWEHALEHPGMAERLLRHVLATLRSGRRKQDRFDPAKFFYKKRFANLPLGHTHIVVVVKFGRRRDDPTAANNFVLTAYLVGGE